MFNAEGSEPNEQIDIDVREVETVLADGTVIEEIDVKGTIVEHPGHADGDGDDHAGGHGHETIVVIVNEDHHVTLHSPDVTGLQIKEAAIVAGARIKVDFKLSILNADDSTQVVGDNERIHVHTGEKFVAVPGDINS